MSSNKGFILAIISFALFSNCKPNDNAGLVFTFPKENVSDYVSSIELKEGEPLLITLDSSISLLNQSFQVTEEQGIEFLTILKTFNNSLYKYKLETGALESRIQFEIEGDNGIGNPSNMGHYYHNNDSIFLSNHWEKKIYLVNSNGEIITTYNLVEPNNEFQFFTMTTPNSQMAIVRGNLIIPVQGIANSMKNSAYVCSINLKTKRANWFLEGDPFMDDKFWGPITPYQFMVTYNFEDSLLISNMAKSPYLRLHTFDPSEGEITKHVSGSQFVSELISFAKINPDKPPMYGLQYKEIASETNRTALFNFIAYDKYNNLYYRQLILPRSPEDYEKGLNGIQLSIIILNANFEKVGEMILPKGKYHPNIFFISKSGLALANLDAYQKNENEIKFDTFIP